MVRASKKKPRHLAVAGLLAESKRFELLIRFWRIHDFQSCSFGPSMWDVHTPDEHVSVPSVGNFWKLLTAVLEAV